MAKVGIHGFGRIGRLFLRCSVDSDTQVVIINTRSGNPKYLAYTFKHDSIHGEFKGRVSCDDKHIIVNKQMIPVFTQPDPKKVPWKQLGADYVLEASGQFTTKAKAAAILQGGAKRVLISAPSLDAPMYVIGVNLCKYDPKETIISMASCTTNCLAPLAKILHDNFGIQEGLMTSVHSVTLTQRILDGADEQEPRSARSALANIIPAPTGAAFSIGKVMPHLNGILTGMAFRVPVVNVSVVDLTVRLKKSTDYETIKCLMREAAEGELKGILAYTEDELVSSDVLGSPSSSIFDAKAGMALNDHFFKIVSWYDNEYGYANRLVEMMEFMHKKDKEACGKKK